MNILQYWRVFVEILILWYAIYMVLLFVKGTRSEQLLKGILIIGLIFFAAQQLRLNAIIWALTRLFPVSIIALVVIFQPELRRGLAQLGRIGIHQSSVEMIDEIAAAAVILAKRRLGALIVIERSTGLKSYIESGTQVDARVTRELITAIFMTQSPLHDGAVIMQHGRLVAAGCILPLPQEERGVPRSFGMRHRAAIGISEETDAVCVVVSEETGAISVASNGRLTHNLDAEGLVRSLRSIFYRPPKKRHLLKMPASLIAKNDTPKVQ